MRFETFASERGRLHQSLGGASFLVELLLWKASLLVRL